MIIFGIERHNMEHLVCIRDFFLSTLHSLGPIDPYPYFKIFLKNTYVHVIYV